VAHLEQRHKRGLQDRRLPQPLHQSSWTLTNVAPGPHGRRRKKINANMQSEGALLASIE
jgi:hypothetical protein